MTTCIVCLREVTEPLCANACCPRCHKRYCEQPGHTLEVSKARQYHNKFGEAEP